MELEKILQEWEKDAVIDQTEPGKELIRIPLLHSKYLNFLTKHKMASKKVNYDYLRMRKVKWEYYTGKMSQEELAEYGWEPFQFTLKSDITTYLESDEDINKHLANKILHDEIVDVCQSILKELNSRTFQLRDFIAWERFIQGV